MFREIEVVEHINGNILETIRKKLSDKKYEANTILVCHVSQGGIFDFKKMAEIISKEITSLNNIFLAFSGLKLSDIPEGVKDDDLLRSIFKTSLVQLKPVFTSITIDPIKDCTEWRKGNESNFFIFEGIGRGGSKPITLKNPPKLF